MKFSRLIDIAYAMESTKRQHRCFHCAFIFKGNKIYSIGWNILKTHPITKKHPYTKEINGLHAEAAAAIKFGELNCSGLDFFVLRIGESGKIMNSKPCPGCQSLIGGLNFRRIHYTDNQGQVVRL